ncbi:mitochondrial 37S ribosomal protein uS17m, partial [Lipomyces oligophaga]|uniref:mitochondrial 37S ribosomal protein uS17m n=1 Tax=Lipomyces oligophaga TaxID=45792 RepID=UPI0034CE6314
MRQNFVGVVVSQGKMAKTVKVRVNIPVFNTKYDMMIHKRRTFLVHDEGELTREGDVVRIESTRPLSAKKHFAVAEIKNPLGATFEQYRGIGELEEEYVQFLKTHK